jgi:hypothetical protein
MILDEIEGVIIKGEVRGGVVWVPKLSQEQITSPGFSLAFFLCLSLLLSLLLPSPAGPFLSSGCALRALLLK